MSKDSEFKDMVAHVAPQLINRLWDRIESDCYYNFEDIPADYNQIHEVRIVRAGFKPSAYNYIFNNVLYPGDIRANIAVGKMVNDMKSDLLRKLLHLEETD